MVYEAMKRTMDKTLIMLQNRYVVDLFTKLRAKNIGTSEITSLCQRACQKLPKGRANTLRNTLLKWKLKDATAQLQKSRYENTKTWREVKQTLVSENILAEYEELWSREKNKESKKHKEHLKSKISFLNNKYGRKNNTPDSVYGVTIADQPIPPDFSSEPRIYGDVALDEFEKELLALPPKFALYEDIDPLKLEIQVEKANSKLRWAIKQKEQENEGNLRTEREKIFNPTTKTFNFRDMRGTDLKFNRRIKLPPAVNITWESKMRLLSERLKEVTNDYLVTTSNKNHNNLSRNQNKGLKTLTNKIASGNIVVFQTDKSGRFSVDTTDNYLRSGECHVEGDTIITQKDHEEIESLLNSHSRCWVRMLGAGTRQSDQKRIKDDLLVKNTPPAPLYVLRKDHKVTPDPKIGPPTRPVCGANQAATMRLSYLLNLIISEVWKDNSITVCLSTEEMVAEIDAVNNRDHPRGLIIGSTDVVALYPSLDIDFTVNKVCEVIRKSPIQFAELWYEELGLYVAIHTSVEEIDSLGLTEVCPTRTTNMGSFPTVKSLNPQEIVKRYKNWRHPEQSPNETQKRELIIRALHIAIKFIMNNHTYTFGNQIRKQSKGGPIGLDITGAIAQIYMIWWAEELKTRLSNLGIVLEAKKCYVDDVNIAMPPTEPGLRYQDGAIIREENLVLHDTGLPEDLRTMLLYKSIANDIHPSTQVEVDCPSKHDDNRMPLLDLKVWVENKNGRSVIMHEHYAKNVSSKMVINANSALPMNTKRTVLAQEGLRILLNCSRDLPWENKTKHLNNLSLRMQYSGYNKQFRYQVINSSINAYNNLINKETAGVRPLYRNREWNKIERREMKDNKKKDWYKEDSCVFIPATPDSCLSKHYKRVIREVGLSIRVVEVAGPQLKRKLQKSDPFKKKKCERPDCLICPTDGKGPCDVSGVSYNIKCKDCGEVLLYHKYEGETSHSGYSRGKEHQTSIGLKKGALYRHMREKHAGNRPNFQMNVTGIYGYDAMLRQISEAVAIRNSDPKFLMNNKSEWNHQVVPQVVIQRT